MQSGQSPLGLLSKKGRGKGSSSGGSGGNSHQGRTSSIGIGSVGGSGSGGVMRLGDLLDGSSRGSSFDSNSNAMSAEVQRLTDEKQSLISAYEESLNALEEERNATADALTKIEKASEDQEKLEEELLSARTEVEVLSEQIKDLELKSLSKEELHAAREREHLASQKSALESRVMALQALDQSNQDGEDLTETRRLNSEQRQTLGDMDLELDRLNKVNTQVSDILSRTKEEKKMLKKYAVQAKSDVERLGGINAVLEQELNALKIDDQMKQTDLIVMRNELLKTEEKLRVANRLVEAGGITIDHTAATATGGGVGASASASASVGKRSTWNDSPSQCERESSHVKSIVKSRPFKNDSHSSLPADGKQGGSESDSDDSDGSGGWQQLADGLDDSLVETAENGGDREGGGEGEGQGGGKSNNNNEKKNSSCSNTIDKRVNAGSQSQSQSQSGVGMSVGMSGDGDITIFGNRNQTQEKEKRKNQDTLPKKLHTVTLVNLVHLDENGYADPPPLFVDTGGSYFGF